MGNVKFPTQTSSRDTAIVHEQGCPLSYTLHTLTIDIVIKDNIKLK